MGTTQPEPRHPLHPDTIALGRRRIAEIRAQLHHHTTVREHQGAAPLADPPHSDRDPDLDPVDDADDADLFHHRLAAGMAAGAERDRLEARITQLETEVAQLRGALATILHTAAHAVSPDELLDPERESPNATSG